MLNFQRLVFKEETASQEKGRINHASVIRNSEMEMMEVYIPSERLNEKEDLLKRKPNRNTMCTAIQLSCWLNTVEDEKRSLK